MVTKNKNSGRLLGRYFFWNVLNAVSNESGL